MTEAFVTLATSESYALGALVLAQSLRAVGTERQLVVMISKDLSPFLRELLSKNFDRVVPVEELDSQDAEHLRLLARPELGITFTKLNCWLLEEYSKCVFLDADVLVLQPIDDLFQRQEFSAAPDAGWPDCFNSGVFVYRPSKETYGQLMSFASEQHSSFDGGDQGLLNRFFSDWSRADLSRHLPFTYNVTSNTFYSYLPAVTEFRSQIRVVHFAGAVKPWQLTFNTHTEQLSGNLSGQSDVQHAFLRSWWKIFTRHVLPQFNSSIDETNSDAVRNFTATGEFRLNNVQTSFERDPAGIESGSAAHRRAWEAGLVDYQGRDSFSNIQEQLERNIAQQPLPYHPSISRPQPQQIPATKKTSEPLKETPVPVVLQSSVSTTKTVESIKVIPVQVKPVELIKVIPVVAQKVELAPSQPLLSSSPAKSEEISWTVKSTIVTAYTQGMGESAGPTLISKTVSESTSAIDAQLPAEKTSPLDFPLTVPSSPNSFAWLFEKFFLAITYTLSLCYLLFLLVFRRCQTSELLHGSGPTGKHLHPSPVRK